MAPRQQSICHGSAVPSSQQRWHVCAQVDARTDFSKLKVAQLKQLLHDRGVACPECVEKPDFVKRARALFVPGSSAEL